MATILKVKRLSGNPRRHRTVKRRVRRNTAGRRRRMSPKQIAIFGTPRQKAALRSSRKRKRATGGTFRNRRRRRNSALVVTLGAAPGLAGLNPRRRRRKNVARTRRRRRTNRRSVTAPRRRRRHTSRRRRAYNPRRRRYNRRRYNRRRRNRTVVVHVPRRRRRRYNRHHRRMRNRRHHRYNRRRNPSIMGQSLTSKGALKLIGGGLLGVAAVKFIPSLVPAGLIPSGSPYVTVLVTGVAAVLSGWLIGKVDRELGDGATFGGLMVAGSQLINALAPGLSIGGVPIGGLGDLMPGSFVVPQNPLRLPPPPPQPAHGGGARVNMSGLARAYGPAF